MTIISFEYSKNYIINLFVFIWLLLIGRTKYKDLLNMILGFFFNSMFMHQNRMDRT